MSKPGINLRLIGVKELIKNLEDAGERGVKAVGAGLYLEANNIMADSKREVPHDTGTLADSGYVTLPHVSGTTVSVEIGYGGSAAAYAEALHEGMAEIKKGKRQGQIIYFRKFQSGRKSKYLQDPLYAAAAGFKKNVVFFAGRAFRANRGAEQTGIPTKPK